MDTYIFTSARFKRTRRFRSESQALGWARSIWRELAGTGAESAALLARERGVNVLVLVARFA